MYALPLPLELTPPVQLGRDLNTIMRATATSNLCDGDGSESSQECDSTFNLVVIDVQFDIQIDDFSIA